MNRTSAEIAVAQFNRAKRERKKWDAEEDKWEKRVDKFVNSEIEKRIKDGDDHVLTAQEWQKPRPAWEIRTWTTSHTVKKIVFVCSCGEDIATVSPAGGLQRVDEIQVRHLRSVIRKELGVKP